MTLKESARSAFVLRHSGLLDFRRRGVALSGLGEYVDTETREIWEEFWAGVQWAITEQAERERVLVVDDLQE